MMLEPAFNRRPGIVVEDVGVAAHFMNGPADRALSHRRVERIAAVITGAVAQIR
jgi:hypothetical protein